jgi:hypothetical protein
VAGNPHAGTSYHVWTLYRLRKGKPERAMLKPWVIPARDRIFSDYVGWRLHVGRTPYAAAVRGRISAPLELAPPPPIRTVSDFDLPYRNLWCPIKKGRWKRRGRLAGRPVKERVVARKPLQENAGHGRVSRCGLSWRNPAHAGGSSRPWAAARPGRLMPP